MRHYLMVLCLVLFLTIPLHAQDSDTPYEIAHKRIQRAAENEALRLDLSALGLTEVPPEIGQLRNLQMLYLHGNRLTSLPAEIGQLTNLKVLFLYSNRLTDLPAEIGQLSNLYYLTVAYNQLTDLPAQIGQLRNLKVLNLNNNELPELPTEFSNLSNLTCSYCSLDLSDNPLEIPPPEVVKQGTAAVLDYLRNRVWYDMQQLIIRSATGVGLVALVLLGLRYRQTRRKPKAKRGHA